MKTILILLTLISFIFGQWNGFGGGFGGWKSSDKNNYLLEKDSQVIAHYWLNSTNTDTLDDISSNTHDMTAGASFDYANQFNLAAPKIGNALYFDGTNDYTSCTTTDFSLTAGQSMSIEVIINVNSFASTSRIFAVYASSGYLGRIFIAARSDSTLQLAFQDADNTTMSLITTDHINSNTWYYLAFVMDRTNTLTYIYINGSESISSSSISGDGVISNNIASIGCEIYGGTPQYFFDGDISEIYVTNKILSANEIQAQWNKIKDYF